MIRSIQRLRGFGVFDDLTKTAAVSDFAEKNIIYGWNYSGKTTLSRLFGVLASKAAHPDFGNASFTIQDHQGQSITNDTLSASSKVVAVFNSDFIATNLSWTGDSFNPILLLGSDSIEAEKQIERLQGDLGRCREGFVAKKRAIKVRDEQEAEARSAGAKHIKTTLQLVEAYTAAHLVNELSALGPDPGTSLLPDDQYQQDMKLALTAEKDKLRPVPPLAQPRTSLNHLHAEASGLASAKPAFSRTIEYLRANKAVSDWVQEGLTLHADKEACEFCGGGLSLDRIGELHGHFSEDLINHKSAVSTLLSRVAGYRLNQVSLNERDFAAKFSGAVRRHNAEIGAYVSAFNDDIQSIAQALQAKLSKPFDEVAVPYVFPSVEPLLAQAYVRAAETIRENNQLSDNFTQEKKKAVARLKRHMASLFSFNEGIAKKAMAKAMLARHMDRYQAIGERIKKEISELLATIDRSQKGRERLNERITTLLGTSTIEITVVKVGGADRFQLARSGAPAKNLSDGERTAIAFSFFLTKLEEHKDLKQVIVYIDDPISSLDSNHLFQVYSMIESAFFEKVATEGKDEWVTRCKQIFISTHNFEFFDLLKRLPCNKNKTRYFLVKRRTPSASTIENLPISMLKYKSEYHYLFSVIHAFHASQDKSSVELLLSLPNCMRRFFELYTYMRLPIPESTIDQRAEQLFGREKTLRITKLLHHFSHLEAVERVATNTNLVSDISAVVDEIMSLVGEDKAHFDALLKAVPVVA